MRNLFLSMLVLVLSVSALVAQEGADALKSAKRAYDSYTLSSDATKLTEAVDMVEKAMTDTTVAADPKALVEAGDIYAAAANNYVNTRAINLTDAESTERLTDSPAVKAAKAYMKAYTMADEKKGKSVRRSVLKALPLLQGNLSNEGIYAIQDKKFTESQLAFQTSVTLHEFLTENDGSSVLTDSTYLDEKYYAGLSALLNKDFDAAEPLFLDLYQAEYDDVALFDGLYKVYDDKGDKESAYKYLQEGRAKYPDESSLLFTEINYYLAEKKLGLLTAKLEEAIAKEPENVSLYATLGQVYEQLYGAANTEGNESEALRYFDLAQSKYQEGLAKDPEAARLTYSLGAMIYNRGAAMSQELVELGNDFSKEGQKKYEALKATADKEFAKALPYFQKAEMADPNDVNTLIALKEMYARDGEYEISGEFKTRIEKLQAGEQLEKSYFKENGM
jgi:tetratricopeptide (TPR) repeat protein